MINGYVVAKKGGGGGSYTRYEYDAKVFGIGYKCRYIVGGIKTIKAISNAVIALCCDTHGS